MNRMTETKELHNYRPHESIPVIRLTDYPGDRSLVVVTEEDPNIEGCHLLMMNAQYMAGPIVDRLWEYENLGMEPDVISGRMAVKTALIAQLREKIEKLRAELERENKARCDLETKFKNANTECICLREYVKRIMNERDDYKKNYDNTIAELDKAYIDANRMRDKIAELNDVIHRYEIMRQTIQAIFGVNIEI